MGPAVREGERERRPIVFAVLLPLLIIGGTAAADAPLAWQTGKAAEKAVAADRPKPVASAPVPLEKLVPGLPETRFRHTVDTPDQALPPQPRDSRRAEAVPPEPKGAAARLVEYVPPAEVQAAPGRARPEQCTGRTGPYQREVEEFLRLRPDGVQSPGDCRAIRDWQLAEGIQPAIGFAGPTSWGRARLARAKKEPNAGRRCPEAPDTRIACVDLTRQLMWVQRGGDVVFGPVSVRTGMPDHETRTGRHQVYWRNKQHVSSIYETPMPFAQFFDDGEAFHGVYGNIFDPGGGSHGCVNLAYTDAERLWDVLEVNDPVFLWGKRP
ncbi:L,D-transpeptidase [Streptomyces sp. TP-A0874]|uniref:L,D-transpeptidase n=1 Tax=Streptomyces sp. TP-A0874 TaxID=549819 RepID=UPI00099FB394|nr:L,D-transpeptidase [Streptomyces sp. TP-A0874]